MKHVYLVHEAGPNPGHAVVANSPTTLCGMAVHPRMDLARGAIEIGDFEGVAEHCVLAGACPDCVAEIQRQTTTGSAT